MCCLCIQFTHENTSERTILYLVNNNKIWGGGGGGKPQQTPLPGLVACTAKKASYAPDQFLYHAYDINQLTDLL